MREGLATPPTRLGAAVRERWSGRSRVVSGAGVSGMSTASEDSGGLQAWATASEFEETDGSGEGTEEPPMLPGVARVLGNSPTSSDPGNPEDEHAEDKDAVAVIEDVLRLRREMQELEDLTRLEAIELEWLRARVEAGPAGNDSFAKPPPVRGGEGAEQRRRRLALDTRARLKSAPRSDAPRPAAVVVSSSGDGPRTNKAAALRQQRVHATQQAPPMRRRKPSTEWANVPPRYLGSTVSSHAHSPRGERAVRNTSSSEKHQEVTTSPTFDTAAPRATRTVSLRQQHRERTAAIRSHEDTLKEAGTRARKSYMKAPPGFDIAAPSPRSAQAIDRIFAAMETKNLRTKDLLPQLENSRGRLSGKDVKAAFSYHGVQLSDADIHALVRVVDMDGDEDIAVHDFIEQMRKLKSARRKLPGEVDVAVSPELVARINRCGVESRKLAALKLKLKACTYSNSRDPTRAFQQFDRANAGGLEQSEFTAAVRKLGKVAARELSDDELQKLFESFDLDASGRLRTTELMGFAFGTFDLIEEKSTSQVRRSQSSPVRTPRQARKPVGAVAEELRMQRLGVPPAHWAVQVVPRPVGANCHKLTEDAAVLRIQAAARGRIVRKLPALPFESDSEDSTPSDSTLEAEATTNEVTEDQQFVLLEAEVAAAENSQSPTDAEAGYNMVVAIAERAKRQAKHRASAKLREAARRQHLVTNVSFDEAVERARNCLSCQCRSSAVDTVSSLLLEYGQREAGLKRRGRYIPVTHVEHLLRSWSRKWQSLSHDGQPLLGFDFSVVRILSHHLVKTCHEDQTRHEGLGFTGELAEVAAKADESSVMLQ